MTECIKTNKPLVSILIATYNPNMDWLYEQLLSLKNQSYDNLEILLFDDCSSENIFESIKNLSEKTFKNLNFRIIRNKRNLGVNKTFEKATKEAKGEYIAYCDQDDIWKENKISKLVEVLQKNELILAYSDMEIIDDKGNKIAESIVKIRKRIKLLEGEGLARQILIKNFISGCAMMIKSDVAKNSIPFSQSFMYDNYLALKAGDKGRIALIKEPLIQHRIHSKNQTGILKNVNTKSEYLTERIENFIIRAKESGTIIENNTEDILEWALLRKRYMSKPSIFSAIKLYSYRKINKHTTYFELLMPIMSERLFKIIINKIKKEK